MKDKCPRCESTNTFRERGTATDLGTSRRTVAAYWQVCLMCWHKWDGVTNGPGVFPADVESRQAAQERFLIGRGWKTRGFPERPPHLWCDPLNVIDEYTIDAAVLIERGRMGE